MLAGGYSLCPSNLLQSKPHKWSRIGVCICLRTEEDCRDAITVGDPPHTYLSAGITA